jgi:hypothetical protein
VLIDKTQLNRFRHFVRPSIIDCPIFEQIGR